MNSPFFDSRYIKDNIIYGLLASLGFAIPTWIYLAKANFYNGYLLIVGSIIFVTIIIIHTIRLTQKAAANQIDESILMASFMPVFMGVVLSIIFCLMLCFMYIPGFMTGHSSETFLINSPEGMNPKNTGIVMEIFLPATIVDLGVGIFVAVIIPIIMKVDK